MGSPPLLTSARLLDPAMLFHAPGTMPAHKRVAMVLSICITAALFSLILFISSARSVDRGADAFAAIVTIAVGGGSPGDQAQDSKAQDSGAPVASPTRAATDSPAPARVPPAEPAPVPVPLPLPLPLPDTAASAPPSPVSPVVSAPPAQVTGEGAGAAPGPVSGSPGKAGGQGEGMAAGRFGNAFGDGDGYTVSTWYRRGYFKDPPPGREHPPAALDANIEGIVLMRCKMLPRDRVSDCTMVLESPKGWGFGKAITFEFEKHTRARLLDPSGRRVHGEWAIIGECYVIEDERPRRPRSAVMVEWCPL
ncbi:hypothetical protein [Porphyrobacter sp. HT-58-2]|uniref:hypothetical protein n=1 Tax=Porphyrobacter sp. HT-58-2 TaxID=2023229 RepID=UPI0011B0E608|nr:hypothetical protein [Porphyrobacter sp. HT-58-2]